MIWILSLIAIGFGIGSLTQPETSAWYQTLTRSSLTPPNYIFPIAWTVLYGILGVCGWLIWQEASSFQLRRIKILYSVQLLLNWSWSPLFFSYHLMGGSLIVLGAMNIAVCAIIALSYRKMNIVSVLMIPYLSWILFATYLNLYIWQHNGWAS